jgi:hypothetical protein
MVVLLLFGALLGAATKYDNAEAGRMPAYVLVLRGGKGGVAGGRSGIVEVHRLIVHLGSRHLQQRSDVQQLTLNSTKKKYGAPIMLRSI